MEIILKFLIQVSVGQFPTLANQRLARSEDKSSLIRIKALDLEDDIEFLKKIGFLEIKKNKLVFISTDKDPKALFQEE